MTDVSKTFIISHMSMPAKLRKARKKAGYTQSKVGEAFGISREAVALWESEGEKGTKPDIRKLRKLAELYNISINELLDGEPADEAPPNKVEEQQITLTAEQKQLLSFMVNLDKEAQDALLKIGSVLSKNAIAIKKTEEKSYSGPERRLGEDDRRKENLGFDPERRHFFPAPNFPQKQVQITDRRRKEK